MSNINDDTIYNVRLTRENVAYAAEAIVKLRMDSPQNQAQINIIGVSEDKNAPSGTSVKDIGSFNRSEIPKTTTGEKFKAFKKLVASQEYQGKIL